MTNKIKINEEIEKLSSYLDSLEDTHPDYIGPELKKLQNKVLANHAHFEEAMDIIIESKISKGFGRSYFNSNIASMALLILNLQPLLNNLSFRNKIEIIEKYQNVKADLVRALKKANTYRIEFAHPKGSKLREKYKFNTPKGKQNIRDLLRCLIRANSELNGYFNKIKLKL